MRLLFDLTCFPDTTFIRNYFSIVTFRSINAITYLFDKIPVGSITRYDNCYSCQYSDMELDIIFHEDFIEINRTRNRREVKIFFLKNITFNQVLNLVRYNLTSWILIESCLNLKKKPIEVIKYNSIDYLFEDGRIRLSYQGKKIGYIVGAFTNNHYHVNFAEGDMIMIRINKYTEIETIRKTSEFDLIEEEFNFKKKNTSNINFDTLIELALTQDFSINNIKKVLSL